MEPPCLEIPGYYYDKEKKKYFKIQASSTAPSSAAYSSKDVKRRKTQDERAAANLRRMARRKGRIQRSRILENPLAGGFLDREAGLGVLEGSRILAGGLVQQGYLSSMVQFSSCSSPLFAVDHRPGLGPSMVDIRIAFDDQLFTIRVNADKNNRSTAHGSVEICHDFTVPTINNASWRIERFGNSGASTSLSVNEANRRLAMTWLAGSPNSGIAITPMAGIPIDGDLDRPSILLGPGITRGSDGMVDVLSSAAAPLDSSLLFAFGSSHGILTVDKRDFDTKWISPASCPASIPQENHPKDIFALEFLSDNHSVLLSGGRQGILNITDLRVPKFGLNADVITHPSSITHVKQLDTHRIIIAGLNSNLCQYDLRFRKTESAPTAYRSNRQGTNHNYTRPILLYPGYRNNASIQTGFDVDVESGIVAAAQEQDPYHPAVQLFSLHGGHMLKSPRVAGVSTYDDTRPVKCLRFARDVHNKMKSLYVEYGDIQRYTWALREEADSF